MCEELNEVFKPLLETFSVFDLDFAQRTLAESRIEAYLVWSRFHNPS